MSVTVLFILSTRMFDGAVEILLVCLTDSTGHLDANTCCGEFAMYAVESLITLYWLVMVELMIERLVCFMLLSTRTEI